MVPPLCGVYAQMEKQKRWVNNGIFVKRERTSFKLNKLLTAKDQDGEGPISATTLPGCKFKVASFFGRGYGAGMVSIDADLHAHAFGLQGCCVYTEMRTGRS